MAATYEPIATTTLTSTQSSVDFTSISGSYTDLIVVANAAYSGTVDDIRFRLNGTGGSSTAYSYTIL